MHNRKPHIFFSIATALYFTTVPFAPLSQATRISDLTSAINITVLLLFFFFFFVIVTITPKELIQDKSDNVPLMFKEWERH